MPPVPSVKPGVIKDPTVAALFTNKDPEARYADLREIGHGSFGAVFFAFDKDRSEPVAIKKMSFSGKQASEKWGDILKEVAFLNKIHHKHIVEYNACYLKDQTCWLVMEYCIGSAADIVDVLKKGLLEMEIGAIVAQTLSALEYLHSMNRLHRDIKAGNILLSDTAIVKLADFGSASLIDPAQTFIGTPFFMAPEVILAMDEGQYGAKADIWSLGITCVELAERRPPLFNMNAMSALYHIAQNDPPTLAPQPPNDIPWSSELVSFVASCLKKDADERMSTEQCLQHPFIRRQRSQNTINDLIIRTKARVMELDNFQYKKMRKLMYLDTSETRDLAGGNMNDDENFDDIRCHGMDKDLGGSTSSRSMSVKSLSSFQSLQNSQRQDSQNTTNKRLPIPPALKQQEPNRTMISVGEGSSGSQCDMNDRPLSPTPIEKSDFRDEVSTLRNHKSKFSTLRSAKLISKEQEEYTKENNMYEQMSGYKRLRQGHHKELQQLEERCTSEVDAAKSRMDKELNQTAATQEKERLRLKSAHISEMEKRRKENDKTEKKLRDQMGSRQDQERKAYVSMQTKEYKHNKELHKSSLKERSLPRSTYDASVKEMKGHLMVRMNRAVENFSARLRHELDGEVLRCRRSNLQRIHSVEEKLDDQELSMLEHQLLTRQQLLKSQNEQTGDMEKAQMREVHSMRKKHQEIQHEAESTNQAEYNRRLTDDLKKKHAMQSRQQPRDIKVQEQQIRKQYRAAVKTQTRQFKVFLTQVLSASPREEHRDITTRLKDEQKRKIAMLASEYESRIEAMVQTKTVTLDNWQEEEVKQLTEKLTAESAQLIAYQKTQRQQLESLIEKERKMLEERLVERKTLVEERCEEEKREMQRIRETRNRAREDKQLQERKQLEDHFRHITTVS